MAIRIANLGLAATAVSLVGLAAAQQAPKIPQNTAGVEGADRVVVTAMVPVPDIGAGAPLFTAADLGAMEVDARRAAQKSRSDIRKCGGGSFTPQFDPAKPPGIGNLLALEFEDANRVAAAAGKAQTTTERAEEARRLAVSSQASLEEVAALELLRQADVNTLQQAREKLAATQGMIGEVQKSMYMRRPANMRPTWGELQLDARKREGEIGLGLGAPQWFEGFEIAEVTAEQFKDRKEGDFVRVSGKLVNSNPKAVSIPALSAALIDERGWILASTTVTPDKTKSIKAKTTRLFQIDVRPAPEALRTAIVTFAALDAAKPRLNVGLLCSAAFAGG